MRATAGIVGAIALLIAVPYYGMTVERMFADDRYYCEDSLEVHDLRDWSLQDDDLNQLGLPGEGSEPVYACLADNAPFDARPLITQEGGFTTVEMWLVLAFSIVLAAAGAVLGTKTYDEVRRHRRMKLGPMD